MLLAIRPLIAKARIIQTATIDIDCRMAKFGYFACFQACHDASNIFIIIEQTPPMSPHEL
jgi:hypothetical protein